MLTKLTVSNYALIQKLSVEFTSGLNMVTGETGAGKSIILGALGLILGNRADVSLLKNEDEKCVVEGVFEIQNYNLNYFFEENDLDYDTVTVLRREIAPSGKSRAFINDTPVNLKVMQELGLNLIDIHSQHQNLELGNRQYQLSVIDTISGAFKILEEYKRQFSEVVNLKNELAVLVEKSKTAGSDLDYYRFQFNQLEEAKLNINEQEKLEIEQEKLIHSEEIKTAFQEISAILDNEQFSVIQNIKDAQRVFDKIQKFIPEVPGLSLRMQSVALELKDLREETDRLADKTEHNPARIEFVNNRLNLIYSLEQKHRVSTVSELVELKNTFEEKINLAVGYGNEISSVENKLKTNLQELEKTAEILTGARKKVFPLVEKMVVDVLRKLGIDKAEFIIVHETLPECIKTGKDSVSFLFSANADTQPTEISKIASGGEISRLMLAIKNLLLNSKSLPTIIFDEIDTGISGEVAIKMGHIMKAFSASTQIINITHLPQIAAKGDTHFLVYKYDDDGKTYTSIRRLNEDERIDELAKMVGGNAVTDSTLKTAKELIGK